MKHLLHVHLFHVKCCFQFVFCVSCSIFTYFTAKGLFPVCVLSFFFFFFFILLMLMLRCESLFSMSVVFHTTGLYSFKMFVTRQIHHCDMSNYFTAKLPNNFHVPLFPVYVCDVPVFIILNDKGIMLTCSILMVLKYSI